MRRYRFTRRNLLVGILVYAALGSASFAEETTPHVSLEDLIPAQGTTLDIMQPAPRFQELTKKLQQAAAKEPDWWLAHIRAAPPGEPVAYDTRLGLTEDEFTEYLRLAKKIPLTKAKSVKVQHVRDGDQVKLSTKNDIPELNAAVIDVKGETLTTPFGVVSDPRHLKVESSPMLGAWEGVMWELEEGRGKNKFTHIRFALGKLRESGRGVLFYDVQHVNEKEIVRFSYVFHYDLPH